jgi:hypothetical protein
LAFVKKYAHSTFDRSKFTVVGSPVITDDGILSVAGGGSNCISTSTLPVTNPFKLEFDFIWGDSTSTGMVLFGEGGGTFIRGYRNTNSAYWYLAFNFDNSGTNDYKIVLDSIPFTWNSKQHIVLEYDGNQTYTGKVYQDGVSIGNSTPVTTSQSFRSNVFSTRWTSEVGNNKLDLKTVKFTSNGVPVFSGNKTGVDVIKPDDYTTVGSPSITEDGVASNFTASNYLYKDLSVNSSDFKIETEIENIVAANTTQRIITFNTGSPRILLYSNSAILFDDNNRKPIVRLFFNNQEKLAVVFFDGIQEEKVFIEKASDIFVHRTRILATIAKYEA